MAISPHIAALRAKVGHTRLVLPSVSALIYDDAGGLLLVRIKGSDVWTTPGGTVDPDERPADACVREAWEEAGVLVKPVRLFGVFGGPEFVVRYPNGDESQYVMSAFECVIESGTPHHDDDETVEVRYWRGEEAKSLSLASWLRHLHPIVFERRAVSFHPPTWRPE